MFSMVWVQIMVQHIRHVKLRKQVNNKIGKTGVDLTEKSARVRNPDDVNAFPVNAFYSWKALLSAYITL